MDDTPASTAAVPSKDDLLEAAWGLIANAQGGNWDHPDTAQGWKGAAERWRDKYHAQLGSKSDEPEEPIGVREDGKPRMIRVGDQLYLPEPAFPPSVGCKRVRADLIVDVGAELESGPEDLAHVIVRQMQARGRMVNGSFASVAPCTDANPTGQPALSYVIRDGQVVEQGP